MKSLTMQNHFDQKNLPYPKFHVVLGSGFKDALVTGIPQEFETVAQFSFEEIEGLSASTAPGHSGKFVVIQHREERWTALMQVGRLHGYEGLPASSVVRTVLSTADMGTRLYFLTNAAGGIQPEHRTGDVMMITDHINLTGQNPLAGPNPKDANGKELGPRFQDMTFAYDPTWTQRVEKCLSSKIKTHRGVYMGVLGPSFETPAEIRFFQTAGASAVGMSTVWENISLKHRGAKVVGISLISNPAAGTQGLEELDHDSILAACRESSVKIVSSILEAVLSHRGEFLK